MKNPEASKIVLPRHAAGSAELIGGTGPITGVCSMGSFLEMYKQDKTFHIRSPESIDPEEINPNAPWVTSSVADVGSSSLSVTRVLLQSRAMLDAAMIDGPFDKAAVLASLHSCKEALVSCETLAERICGSILHITRQISADGIPSDNQGRGLNPFPQVANLQLDCGAFLVHINRAIKLVCELPMLFLELDKKDSNFGHLARRLSDAIGSNEPLTEFVLSNRESVKYLIDLRNFHEHPGATRTIIHNFLVLPSGQIQVPTWEMAGKSATKAKAIDVELSAAVGFVQEIAEAMFIHLLLRRLSPAFPYYVEQVADDDIDPALPIRYRLSIDFSRLQVMAAGGDG
jgi:hypothetical protein